MITGVTSDPDLLSCDMVARFVVLTCCALSGNALLVDVPKVSRANPDAVAIGEDLMLVGVDAVCAVQDMLGNVQAESFDEGRAACRADSRCVFVAWSPARAEAALCKGPVSAFTQDSGVRDNVVGVKRDSFAAHGFSVFTNYQAVCAGAQLISTTHGVFDFDSAVRQCIGTADCSFFALSTIAGLEGIPAKFANTLFMCRGTPEFAFHLGWLSAGKLENMSPNSVPGAGTKDFTNAFDGPLPFLP